jgi:TonB C terminal
MAIGRTVIPWLQRNRVKSNRTISVTAWTQSRDTTVPGKRISRVFLPPALIGFIGSLLLHSLVLQSALVGSRTHKIRPPQPQNPGSSINSPSAKPADTLVFIDLPNMAKTDSEIDETLTSFRAVIKNTPIAVIPFDPSPSLDLSTLALDEEKVSAASDNGDNAERARWIGIYSGQIQARVERIWRRPRTPAIEESTSAKTSNAIDYFRCQAQIVQDPLGNVQEILLPNCHGSFAWQRSLVIAIQQASPLPAPPSPTVFSRTLTLEFVGYTYTAGAPEDEYEPLSTAPMQAAISITH